MKYLFLNHKMNFKQQDILLYKESFASLKWKDLEVVVIPSAINIPILMNQPYKLGAQTVSSYSEESYTGEVSAAQLKSFQVEYCLVGHSERRWILNETEQDIKEKMKCLEKEKITPVLCIGESDPKDRRKTLEQQLCILQDLSISKLVIAYEPVYSIGTGALLESEEIEKAIEYIKTFIKEKYHQNFPVIYGGSIDARNIERLAKISNVDGFLIGRSSLKTNTVQKIMEKLNDSIDFS